MNDEEKIAVLREALIDAEERMTSARNILTDNNPRPVCNWGMLDTSSVTLPALAATVPAQSEASERRDAKVPEHYEMQPDGTVLPVDPVDMGIELPQPTQEPHSDDLAVDRFASAMKAKLAKKCNEGRGGWDNPKECEMQDLAQRLIDHMPKGDTIDIANFCMMLYEREQMATEHHPCYGGYAARCIQSAQQPFAWAHDNPNRCDVINNKVRDLWLKVNDKRVEHYTIPLYASPIALQSTKGESDEQA